MYFPYLFGKQRELLAVRAVAQEFPGSQHVAPVVEPVRTDSATLRKTLEVCREQKFCVFLVMNPSLLDFSQLSREAAYNWGSKLLDALGASPHIRPTFIVSETTRRPDLKRFVKDYGSRDVGIVVREFGISPSDLALDLAAATGGVQIFLHGAEPSRGTVAALEKARCVWVEDRFPHKKRNADYAGRNPFTDRHLTWRMSGYAGFSDFTVLPAAVSEGGGPAGAVAVHLTYIDLGLPAREVYVEHFVSDRQDQTERDDPGKMMEALQKYLKGLKRASTSFGVTQAANDYRSRALRDDPPSLAVNKGLQVTHHIELMHGLLDGSFP